MTRVPSELLYIQVELLTSAVWDLGVGKQ